MSTPSQRLFQPRDLVKNCTQGQDGGFQSSGPQKIGLSARRLKTA